ncbi:hypothetical protein DYB25_003524 [Aphanomyces astaci]|uniref:Uncharacterized protein n=1 Tax=Aphanomyces astaci TaxID=112090 RepID=A0A397D1G2_APHAT|nr:hypothetical protein DYB25_003524 [Aphanomyces astaci]RHY54033.1 hypothetical protein DYB38_001472 [Aphanomyces astaci]RHZ29619.1 hypothetical protein DYB26_005955 [Aphanomyces astaci]
MTKQAEVSPIFKGGPRESILGHSLGDAQHRVLVALDGDPSFFLNETGFEMARQQKLKHCCSRVRVWRKNAANPLVAFKVQADMASSNITTMSQKKERRLHVAVLLNVILDAYEQCISRYDDTLAIESLPEYVANTIMQKANGRYVYHESDGSMVSSVQPPSKNGVDQVQATIASMLHATTHPRVRAFTNLCGLQTDNAFNPPEKTIMFLRCVEKIYRVKLKAVAEWSENGGTSIASVVFHNIGLAQAAAKAVVHELFNEPDPYWTFQYLEPTCDELHVSKQSSSSRGMRKIDCDLFLELLLQTWNRRAMQLYLELDAACDAEQAHSAAQVRSALTKCAMDKQLVPLQPFERAGFHRLVDEFWLAEVPWHDPSVVNEYLGGCTRPVQDIQAMYHAFRDECSPSLASTWAWEAWPWEFEWDWGGLEAAAPAASPSTPPSMMSRSSSPMSTPTLWEKQGQLNLGHFGLGDRVVQKMGQYLDQSSSRRQLKTLVLSDNAMCDKGCVTILHAITHSQHALVNLDLSHNRIHANGVAALSDAVQSPKCQLQTLKLSKNNLGDLVGRALLTALANNLTIQSLDLSENSLQACGPAVALLLRSHSKLRHLDLGWNLLRGTHAVAIAGSLGDNNALESLNVSFNSFGEVGLMALAHALPRNGALRVLNVGHNSIHALKDLTKFVKLLRANMSLQSLVLSGNPFGDAVVATLRKLNREIDPDNPTSPPPSSTQTFLHIALEGCTLTTSSTYTLPTADEDSSVVDSIIRKLAHPPNVSVEGAKMRSPLSS